ncbi:MAG: FkbM family methyltransferase [Raineya sp.]|nr:FkbM family methyltransferase [Raineya sp.]
MFNTPILFLVFNRPDTTQQVFDKIRAIKPAKLFIAADGARKNIVSEQEKVNIVRKIILEGIDWNCEVKTLFREKNLGCGRAVSEAITWFFEHVEQGIILEDDTVPNLSFFHFCKDLLDYYKDDERIFMISGNNFQNGIKRGKADYYFSIYTHIWGWATWRRTWQKYDYKLTKLDDFIAKNKIKQYFKKKSHQNFWLNIFKEVKAQKIDTWDFQLQFACLYNNGLAILPNENLVTNIGFRGDATHTIKKKHIAELPTKELKFPLKHPHKIIQSKKADLFTYRSVFNYKKAKVNILESILSKIHQKIKERYHKIIHYYRYYLRKGKNYRKRFEKQKELNRIAQIPRFIEGETNMLGGLVKFVDSASFGFIYHEIFEREIYKFQTENSRPYIIDAGANIGLSVIYFKKLYPNAEIIAFEPDNKVFEILLFNIKSFGFENVQLIQKALWNEETTLRFYSEGADGGRIATQADSEKLIEVSTCRLRNFLNRKVDLLKIDIEGAEITVMEDCIDLLHNVERLFVEYHSFVGKEQKLYKLLEILEKAGFRYQIQHVGVFSPHPFINISEYANMDLQLNIFAYRI